MSQPSCERASFGKFLRLRLEINYMHRFSLENRATRNMATNARETNADILRNCTPVGGNMQVLAVEFKNSYVIRFAEARRTPRNNLKHGLECARRSTDNLKNLHCGRLLFLRLVQCTGEPRDLSFLAGGGAATAHGLWRITALKRRRLVASRFDRFAACSGAPSHCLPQGSGQGIVAGQSSTLEVAGCGFGHRSLNGRPRTQLGQYLPKSDV
jgi:hypothetical protein